MRDALQERLSSPNWGIRIQAQSELETLSHAKEWKALISQIDASNYRVLSVVSRYLGGFLMSAHPSDIEDLLKYIFSRESPLRCHRGLAKDILESFLSSERLGYRKKIDVLISFVDQSSDGIPEPTLIYIVRALGVLKAKGAITHFEPLLVHPTDLVVMEVIRALRRIGDKKATSYLERLFDSGNQSIAAAAIHAFGELAQGGWLQALRLYRQYDNAQDGVRRSILKATLKFRPEVASFMLRCLYRKEKTEALRLQMIKKLGTLPSSSTARFLMEVAAQDASPRLRAQASWAVESLPSLRTLRAIKQGLMSKDIGIRKRAILKAGNLPLPQARALLENLLVSPEKLPTMLQCILVETLVRLPDDPVINKWLLSQVSSKDTMVSVTAITGLFCRRNTPILEMFEVSDKMELPSIEALLTLLADNHVMLTESQAVPVKKLLGHELFHVRYLVAQILIRQKNEAMFKMVWNQALREQDDVKVSFSISISMTLSQCEILPGWLPFDDEKFFGMMLANVRTAAWDLNFWRQMVCLLSLPGKVPTSVNGFFLSQRHFWLDILNPLLVSEREQSVLASLCGLACQKIEFVSSQTLASLFAALKRNEYRDPEPVLSVFAAARASALVEPFVDWLTGVSNVFVQEKAFRALSSWLEEPRQKVASHG